MLTVYDWWSVSGWWFGAVGMLAGLVGVLWGIWARSHPAQTRLRTHINTYPIGFPNDRRIKVSFEDVELKQPFLVEIDVEHAGGEEIETRLVDEIRFASAPDAPGRVVGPLGDTSSIAELKDGAVSLKPRIFKVGEKASLSLMAEGDPRLIPFVRMARVRHVSDTDTIHRAKLLIATSLAVALVSLVVAFISLYTVSGIDNEQIDLPNQMHWFIAASIVLISVGAFTAAWGMVNWRGKSL